MNWEKICEHPSLQNLPFKIELNEHGEIIMNAVRVIHSLYQGEIEFLLRSLLKKGRALPKCAIKTSKGTKVTDVAWASPEVLRIIKYETECSIAPEICIEVLSSSNTNDEMLEKRHLYFEAQAKEVWICNKEGKMSFYNISGQLKNSLLVSRFPSKIEVDL